MGSSKIINYFRNIFSKQNKGPKEKRCLLTLRFTDGSSTSFPVDKVEVGRTQVKYWDKNIPFCLGIFSLTLQNVEMVIIKNEEGSYYVDRTPGIFTARNKL